MSRAEHTSRSASTEASLAAQLDEAQCRNCGYSLRGLTEWRCPECGTEFDPRIPETIYAQALERRARRDLLNSWLPIGVWAVSMSIVSKLVVTLMGARYSLEPLLLVPGILIAGIVRGYVRRRLLTAASDVTERLFKYGGYIACIIIVVASCRFDVCPHAKYYEIDPVGVAYSQTGGPCGNHSRWSMHLFGCWYLYHH